VAQVVACLPSKGKVLSSNPSTTSKKMQPKTSTATASEGLFGKGNAVQTQDSYHSPSSTSVTPQAWRHPKCTSRMAQEVHCSVSAPWDITQQ
jgi:hypothetical protein